MAELDVDRGETLMDRNQQLRQAAEIFAQQEGKTLEEKLREDDATEEEIRELLDDSDPANESRNSEDTRLLLRWLGVLAMTILVIVVLILII